MTKQGMRFLRTAAIAGLTLALTSCSLPDHSPATDGDPDIPAINWPHGKPDANGFDSAWADTIFEYSTTFAAAYNERSVAASDSLRNLTMPEAFAMLSDPDYFEGTTYYPGPIPRIIVDLEADDSTATATVCSDGGWAGQFDRDMDQRMQERKLGSLSEWNLIRTDEGEVKIASILSVYPENSDCSIEGVKYGLFDPQPPYGEFRAADGE